jgi:hypothetical protein
MRAIEEFAKLCVAVFLLVAGLFGCASPAPNGMVAFDGICGMVPMQQTEGVIVVRMICQAGAQ